MMNRGRTMRQWSMLRSPKKEEQQVVPEIYQNIGNLEETKGLLSINYNFDAKVEEDGYICKLEDHFLGNNNNCDEHDFLGLEFLSSSWEIEEKVSNESRDESFNYIGNDNYNGGDVKREDDFGSSYGFWDENVMEETKASLNLKLNYEEVLEAWSNRGSLWAHHHQQQHNHYKGEVPNLEDESTRRKTSVLRYKEKRHNRLFSKKIRYEVRKLNADKRPRLKGRFVKRGSDNKSNALQEM